MVAANRSAALASIITASVIGGACQTPPQVLVRIRADPAAAARASALRIVVFDSDDLESYRREARFDGLDALQRLDARAAEITLLPRDHDTSRRWRLVASLVDDVGAPFNELEAAGRYASGAREVRLRFEDACSDALPCPRGRTCSLGVCVDACVVSSEPGATTESERVPCGCDVLETASPCTSADGLNGRCWGGACCTGCWDGSSCRTGLEDAACGAAGTECIGCCESCAVSGTCTDLDVNHIATREAHVCVTAEGTAYCWGKNTMSQLGTGDAVNRCEPTAVRLSTGDIAVGNEFTCALGFGGDLGLPLGCWGAND